MKRSKPLRKKRKAVSPIQKALDAAEESWKKAVHRRDKGICQVHKERCQDDIKQADHFRSRRHGWTFLDIRNGTLVCKSLNGQKAKGWNQAAERIAMVVLKREGENVVEYLMEMSRQPKKWTLTELEEIKKQLDFSFLD